MQARDVFDIHLLDSRGAVDDAVLRSIDPQLREIAAEKLIGLTFEEYEGQVVEFLTEDGRRDYGSSEHFHRLHDRVLTLLTRDVEVPP